jgi:hypothetical protein
MAGGFRARAVASRYATRALARRVLLGAVGAAFSAWAALFVRASSFVTSDGVRRYCLFDDAMVSMRYGWNLAHGQGLVWNPGERVEGFTNLLQTLHMALWSLVLSRGAAVLAVQASGAFFVLAAGLLSAKVAERLIEGTRLEGSVVVPAAALALALFYYPLGYWSLMGMEAGMLAALLSASVLLAMRADGQPRAQRLLPVLLGLALLTRPDAAVPVALVLACRGLGLRGRPGALRALVAEAGVVAAFVASVSAFRWAYYGRLTPNTYLLKMTGLDPATRLKDGLAFVEPFLRDAAGPMALGLLAALAHRSRTKLLLASLVPAAVAYQVYVGGDPWLYWRQMAPAMPLLTALVTVEIASIVERRIAGPAIDRLARRRFFPPLAALRAAIVVGLCLLVALALNARFRDEQRLERPPLGVERNRRNVEVALALNDLARPGASVGVLFAGTIPYYTGLPAVDFLGKTDPVIAALPADASGRVSWNGMRSVPGHNKYDLEHSIKGRRPTFVQTARWGGQNLTAWVAEHYRLVHHRGARLLLERDSPYVDWRRVREEEP